MIISKFLINQLPNHLFTIYNLPNIKNYQIDKLTERKVFFECFFFACEKFMKTKRGKIF